MNGAVSSSWAQYAPSARNWRTISTQFRKCPERASSSALQPIYSCWVRLSIALSIARAQRRQAGGSAALKFKLDPEKRLHLLVYADPAEGPETNWTTYVPEMLRGLGPWASGPDGECERLKSVYRDVLRVHGFMVLNCRPTLVVLEEPECSARPREPGGKNKTPWVKQGQA